MRKSAPEDGLLYLGNLEVPDEALPGELQGDHPGTIAVDPGSASTYKVVLRGGGDAGGDAGPQEDALVEAPVLTRIGMSESSSLSHSRQAGALSAARASLLGWSGRR